MKPYFEVKILIHEKEVRELLVNAFEGGSNYWYYDLERLGPIRTPYLSEDCATDGFKIRSMEHDGEQYTVTPDMYNKALQELYDNYQGKFDRLENADGDVADCFLQILCFGQVELG